jgi:carotenoid cleavage dioxygenase-like enzyme
VSPGGELSPDVAVDVQSPQMMHDFAVTEHYAVFLDHALVFDGEHMVRHGGMPFSTDHSRPSRIGLLPRREPSCGVRWFPVDPFVFFHTATAWEEGPLVHVVLSQCAPCPGPRAALIMPIWRASVALQD